MMIFVAIMAAEERRKQKEQIKILKQQVGFLFYASIADKSFLSLALYLCVLTHIVLVLMQKMLNAYFVNL